MWRRVEHQSAEVTPAFAGSFYNGCNSITLFFFFFFYILKSQLGNCSLPARVGLFSRSHHWKPVSISSTIIYLTAQSIKRGGGNCCVSMFCSAEWDMHERDGGDLHCKNVTSQQTAFCCSCSSSSLSCLRRGEIPENQLLLALVFSSSFYGFDFIPLHKCTNVEPSLPF